ncbi:MAG: hypothetical protein AAF108_06445 [Planctomycetota bacterium]
MRMLVVGMALLCLCCGSVAGQGQCSEEFHKQKLGPLPDYIEAIPVARYPRKYAVVEKIIHGPRERFMEHFKMEAYGCKYCESPEEYLNLTNPETVVIHTPEYKARLYPGVGGVIDIERDHPFVIRLFRELDIQASIREALSGIEIIPSSGHKTTRVPSQCRNQEARFYHYYYISFGRVSMQSDRRWWRLYNKDNNSAYYISTFCDGRVFNVNEKKPGGFIIYGGPGDFGNSLCCERDGKTLCCDCASK